MDETATPAHARRVVTAKVGFPGGECTFYLFDTPMSRLTCQDVLTGKSYPPVPLAGTVRTIVDVGAHVGAASVYFSMRFPQARILAFEPSPHSYRLLVRNTEGLANVETFNIGLFDRNGSMPLHLGRQDSITDSIGRCGLNSPDSVPIELKDAKTVLQEQNLETIDILKLDTEGCEPPILRSIDDLLPQVGIIYVEYHHDDDRSVIDRLLSPTHLLFRGRVTMPHRAEFCYVARNRIPEDAKFSNLGIQL